MDTYFIQLFCYFNLILFCGDITATYEMMDADKGVYYTDNAYSVDSAELIYKTASFHNFNFTLGFRGYKVLWEDKDPLTGVGDANSRFYNIDGDEIAVTTKCIHRLRYR